jgi:hypothetical protein
MAPRSVTSSDAGVSQEKEGLLMTSFLFAMPGFSRGMGRAVDLGDTMTQYNSSSTSEEADAGALSSDWVTIGAEIRDSANSLMSVYVR